MKKSILVIENNGSMRSDICRLLYSKKFKVISAPDGCIGFLLAKEIRPDLIICDINLPNLNGFEVLHRLREDVATAKIPFIFHTGETDPDTQRRAMQLGANGYLTKPAMMGKLLKTVTNQCKLARSVKVKG